MIIYKLFNYMFFNNKYKIIAMISNIDNNLAYSFQIFFRWQDIDDP